MEISEYEIEYGATRPLKFRTYLINSSETEDFLDVVVEYVAINVNIDTAAAMDHVHFYRLIEKTAIMICKNYSPTANYGITKPEIRSAIKYAINLWTKASISKKESV